ncbi:MAG: hypothetical protein WC630_01340 [Candidatus Babeliales bacterium]|jgi:hypothetical protein
MEYSSALLKKIIALSLLCATSAPAVSATTVTAGGDPYVLEFARTYSDHVEFVSDANGCGKLTLYANPITLKIILKILVGLGACAAGGVRISRGWSGLDRHGGNLGLIDRVVHGALGAAGCGLGLWSLLDGIGDLSLKKNKVPYITLDADGLTRWNSAHMKWSDADHSDITTRQETTSTTNHWTEDISTTTGTTKTIRTFHLYDKYNSDLFSISDNDFYLSVSFDQLRALIEHYMACHGRQALHH